MSHLHLVDGVIAPVWWVSGYVAAILGLMFAISRIKKEDLSKKVPYIGVISALMLLTMSIPLGFLPFHLNLTIIAGILAGPWLGFVAVFTVNFMMALIGHGGITVVGLNTLIIGTEVVLGFYIFNALRKQLKPVVSVALTVIVSLLISTSFMVGVIALTDAGLANALPHNESEHREEVSGPVGAVQEEEEPGHEEESLSEHLSEVQLFNISGWGAVASILVLGIVIETLVSSLVISYFIKVKPDLVLPEPVPEDVGENPVS